MNMRVLNSDQYGATIQVTGDVTADWSLLVPTVVAPRGLEHSYQWETPNAVQLAVAPGGAALLTNLIESTVGVHTGGQPIRVDGVTIPHECLTNPANDAATRTYARWQPAPLEPGDPTLVWRLHEFLGTQPGQPKASPVPAVTEQMPTCLVIDDANLGFREQSDAWPSAVQDGDSLPVHVILKMANPLGTGLLWETLAARYMPNLTVYCTLGDLRKEFAPVGQALSWERLASEVTGAVRARRDLARAARVVVSVGLSGAIVIERDGPSHLVFDPLHQEGDWEASRPGTPVGLGTCLNAALAIETARCPEQPDWLRALGVGLAAARTAHNGRVVQMGTTAPLDAGFPHSLVAQVLADLEPCDGFRTAEVPADPGWRILATMGSASYPEIATRIVVEGERTACRYLPIDRFGAWVSIDRAEIESLRSVRTIMHEYVRHPQRSRPLSLAVFGPPGSGKSFAIKQLASAWMRAGTSMTVLEVNLSQMDVPDSLPAALQQVRDSAVAGSLPLVFWDEFDTTLGGRELGWLAQFLAPMQDGTFVERGIIRPIGPAIFVFAGGTNPTMAQFKEHAVQIPATKATDFLSRLRGFVDILGPNPLDASDQTYLLRRALLLRTLLHRQAPGLFRDERLSIDPGVLQAFLHIATYLHGARSLEAIVDMSGLSGKLRYERSALPPPHQLSLHVDADEFLQLVQMPSSADPG
jgi:hypothetical protein